MRSFSFLLVILASCTVPDKASLEVMRETKSLQKSPIVLRATNHGKATDDKLELRENNSFKYQSHLLGTQKITIYAGTFNKIGDTLILHFHNGHKDSLWTGKAVIDRPANTITIFSKDTSFNTQLIIGGKK
jgi:hypothetical protein